MRLNFILEMLEGSFSRACSRSEPDACFFLWEGGGGLEGRVERGAKRGGGVWSREGKGSREVGERGTEEAARNSGIRGGGSSKTSYVFHKLHSHCLQHFFRIENQSLQHT